MSGSRGATCPGQNGSNMSSSEGPIGDMWQLLIGGKSQSGWISGQGNPLNQLEGDKWRVRGQKGDIFFSHGAVRAVGRRGGACFQKWRVFRGRSSTFSLEFPAIGSLVSGEARSKVAPNGKGYTWVPVLWSFDKL